MKINYKKLFLSILILWILCIFTLFALLPKKDISDKERRRLASLPEISISAINKESFIDNINKYIQDHFPMRDYYLNIKIKLDSLKLQSNGYSVVNGYITKIPNITNNLRYEKTALYYKNIVNDLFKSQHKNLALIPDKNYYIENSIYPKIDYEKIKNIFKNNLNNFNYIELKNYLRLEDYYKSDLHWKQENLLAVSKEIVSSLGRNYIDKTYNKRLLGNFFGGYASASGKTNILDEMYILENEAFDNYEIKDLISNKKINFYNKDLLKSIDPYNVYLDGPTPLIEIKNKDFNEKGQTLYIFRDSFSSSLAPLLATSFDRIVLIDSRYISTNLLKEKLKPNEKDQVLVLLSYEIIKDSTILKK